MRTCLCIAFALLFSSACVADVAEIEGTITQVTGSTIEIDNVVLTVTDKCPVLIDGKEATVRDLKKGVDATVEYYDDLEIAKSITVGGRMDAGAMAKDLAALQGDWVATTLVISGKELSRTEMRRHFRHLSFDGNKFREEIVRNGEQFVITGLFALDPKTKEIDLIGRGQFEGKDPNANALEMLGFYEIKGDTIRLVLRQKADDRTSRPSRFGEKDEGKAWTNSYVLERD